MPSVSVIIPTYNRAEFICESLESVFAQTYRDFEVIVVDDGSTDNTEDVLKPYLDRIRYVKQENSGSAIARNRGIFLSLGKYVAFLDSDDIWYPTKLEKQIDILEKNDSVGFVYSDCFCGTDPESPEKSGFFANVSPPSGNIFERMTHHNLIWTPSLVVRKEVFCSAGVFDPSLRRSQDYDLWLRICFYNTGVYIDEILVFVREHQTRITKNYLLELNVCRAYEIQSIRWAADENVENVFLQRAADLYINLSRTFRKRQDFAAATYCYKRALRLIQPTIKQRIMFFLLRNCQFVFKWYDSNA